jgi:hypothetical protein
MTLILLLMLFLLPGLAIHQEHESDSNMWGCKTLVMRLVIYK